MLAIPATRYTDKTLTDRKVIAERLARIVEEGVAYDFEEQQQGVCAIAVPVFEKGSVVLSLGAVVPVERFGEADVGKLKQALIAASGVMGARLEKAAYAWRDAVVI
jgi:IclR family acetate operon transcriptional repressor